MDAEERNKRILYARELPNTPYRLYISQSGSCCGTRVLSNFPFLRLEETTRLKMVADGISLQTDQTMLRHDVNLVCNQRAIWEHILFFFGFELVSTTKNPNTGRTIYNYQIRDTTIKTRTATGGKKRLAEVEAAYAAG